MAPGVRQLDGGGHAAHALRLELGRRVLVAEEAVHLHGHRLRHCYPGHDGRALHDLDTQAYCLRVGGDKWWQLQEKGSPGVAKSVRAAGPAEPRCSSIEACVVAMRFCVGVAASPSEVVEVACEGRRGQFSARARRLGARLEIRVQAACAGTTPASPGRVAAGTSHQRAVKSRRHA